MQANRHSHAKRGASLLSLALAASLGLSPEASADITGFTIISVEEIGPFRGNMYRSIEGLMQGTAPGGAYSVPAEIIFPADAEDFNGFALVDVMVMNSIGTDFPPGGRPYPTRRLYGDDYLFGSGNIYVGVLWDKAGLETLGIGEVAAAGDEYEIIRDAAALARDPELGGFPSGITPARSADQVIATGFSSTANLLRAWFHHGLNQAEGDPVFDGAVLASARTVNCQNRVTGQAEPCDIARTDGAKIISVMSEFDMETRGPIFRGETADYRQMEVAGLSHISAPFIDFRPYGFADQNPVDPGPVYRAALENLQVWLSGGEPPASIYLDIPAETTRMVQESPFWDAVRDDDGNAVGGLRLPHMQGGDGVGAPLGQYRSTRESGPQSLIGWWVPFSEEEIRTRYPSRDAYVGAVTAAADALVMEGYILPEDRDSYVAEAEAAEFWG